MNLNGTSTAGEKPSKSPQEASAFERSRAEHSAPALGEGDDLSGSAAQKIPFPTTNNLTTLLDQPTISAGRDHGARSKYDEALKLRLKLNEKGLAAETLLAFAELELQESRPTAADADASGAATQFGIEKEVDQEALA